MATTAEPQTAISAIVEAMRRRHTLAQRTSSPQFLNLGRSFQVNEECWSGPTIISPDALFLFRFERGFHSGMGDPDAVKARDLLAIPHDPLSETALAFTLMTSNELPPLITSHPDWPFPAIRECSVLIVPRDLVAAVLYVPGTNSLHFTTGGRLVQVGCEVIEPMAASEYLRNIGWPTGRRGDLRPRDNSKLSMAASIAGALGLAVMAGVTFSSSISSQLGLVIGLGLSAGAVALVARVWAQLRPNE